MAHRVKRQKLSEDGDAVATVLAGLQDDLYNPAQDKNDNLDQPALVTKNSRSLFIRSLASSTTTEALTNLFSQSYPIKHAFVVVDPTTKKSKGYGFVTFADAADAEEARKELNGFTLDGRKIKVDTAEPRHREVYGESTTGTLKSRSTAPVSDSKPRASNQGQTPQPTPKLIVRNLPWSVKTSDELALLFRSYGKVKQAILPQRKAGMLQGFGFVVLRGRKNAEKAIAEVNGKAVDGRTLAVDWAVEKAAWEEKNKSSQVDESFVQAPSKDNLDGKDSANGPAGGPLVSEDQPEDTEGERSEEYDTEPEGNGNNGTDIREDYSNTLFIRNLPFTATDNTLFDHFRQFGPLRYARVVEDQETARSRGTGFVCFHRADDALNCLKGAPKPMRPDYSKNGREIKFSILEDIQADPSGRFSIDGRVLQISKAVAREEADRLADEARNTRESSDRDKRRLFLLAEGNISQQSPLFASLPPSEVKMRQESARQRQAIVKGNPMLHISLTRLSVRNIPHNISSKDLKALAREAVVGFAKDVKAGLRQPLSKEELLRGGDAMKQAEKQRKVKGQGIVRQAQIVLESKEGTKVSGKEGVGRSRGYGFIEYSSHRCALMGLRWLNGHQVGKAVERANSGNEPVPSSHGGKRLIVEFAIENAQVVARRHGREEKKKPNTDEPDQHSTKDRKTSSSRMQRYHDKDHNSAGEDIRANSKHLNLGREETRPLKGKIDVAKRNRIMARKRALRKSRHSAA